ncbi:MAG: response regulator [Steroidobacteraceae bacterium]
MVGLLMNQGATHRSAGVHRLRETRILLIEDSPLVQIRLKDLLESPGEYRVSAIVDSAPGARAVIEAEVFEVLIVDVQLKQGTGIEVVKYARSRYGKGQRPLIIVLTNYGMPTVEARCREAGADHFLDKIRQFDLVRPLIIEWRREHAGN